MINRDRYTFAALLAVEALLVCLLALFCVPDASAQERVWTSADTLYALQGAPDVVRCIVERETGWTFDPYSLGAAGEQGVAQILPAWNGGGQWNEFHYSFAWTSMPVEARTPYSPFQSVAYLEFWGRRSGGTYWPWTTWRYC